MTDTILEIPVVVEEHSETTVGVGTIEYDTITCKVEDSSCLLDVESVSIIEVESVSIIEVERVDEVIVVEASALSVDVVSVDAGIPGPPGKDGFEWATINW